MHYCKVLQIIMSLYHLIVVKQPAAATAVLKGKRIDVQIIRNGVEEEGIRMILMRRVHMMILILIIQLMNLIHTRIRRWSRRKKKKMMRGVLKVNFHMYLRNQVTIKNNHLMMIQVRVVMNLVQKAVLTRKRNVIMMAKV